VVLNVEEKEGSECLFCKDCRLTGDGHPLLSVVE
jgi:hypothetical protein